MGCRARRGVPILHSFASTRILSGSPDLAKTQLASREKDGKFVLMGVCKMWIPLSSQDVSFLTSTPPLQSELGTGSPLCFHSPACPTIAYPALVALFPWLSP